jgi:hypothetical protein
MRGIKSWRRISQGLATLAPLCAIVALAVSSSSRSRGAATPGPTHNADSVTIFLGRWDLTLEAPDRTYPSWLELRRKGGQLAAQMVGRWGNARPLPKAAISGEKLTFVSPKEEEGAQADMVFEGTLKGTILSGSVNGPDGKTWTWTGRRAPALQRSAVPSWGKPISLFNGRDLAGWHVDNPNAPKKWTVENGELVSPGNGPELINDSQFEDFKLHVEFNCGENANSGVYLRGRYEVQIETDSIDEPPSHHMGSIYGFLAPTPELPRTPGKWQTYDITLVGRTVTVIQNGQTIIDRKEIPGITGGALDSHEELPGPIYLQGSEEGQVLFRKVVITPAERSH